MISPEINVSPYEGKSNGFLKPQDLYNSSRRHSTSSERSRITVVEEDSDIPILPGSKSEKAKVITVDVPELRWLDHLRGVFCIPPKRLQTKEIAMPKGTTDESNYEFARKSPWILPVFALSTQKYDGEHFVPKQAQCTIDTGNHQGNIVSRHFLLNILHYDESSFQELTIAEKQGYGVTGHTLKPQGAVYITWYHSRSTKLFRDMRFLVSPYEHCDLIIGERSIEQHNLLGKPNLTVGEGGKTGIKGSADQASDLKANRALLKSNLRALELKLEAAEDANPPRPAEVARLKLQISEKQKEYNLENIKLKQSEIEHEKNSNNPNKATIERMERELRELPDYKEPEPILAKSGTATTGSSTTTQSNGTIKSSARKIPSKK